MMNQGRCADGIALFAFADAEFQAKQTWLCEQGPEPGHDSSKVSCNPAQIPARTKQVPDKVLARNESYA